MEEDQELQGLVGIIEHQLHNKTPLKQVILKLEEAGFDPEKIKQAVLIADEEKLEQSLDKKDFTAQLMDLFKGNSITKPLALYAIMNVVLFIIVLTFLGSTLSSVLHVELSKYLFLICVIGLIALILNLVSFMVEAYVLHYIAGFFVKEFQNNTYLKSVWILFWARVVSLYFMLIVALSITTPNAFLLIFISYILMLILVYALVAFFYVISFGKAILVLILYAIALFFIESIFSLLLNVIALAILGTTFLATVL